VADASQLEQELQALSVELRKLEGEYNMYFAGRTPRPPFESRNRVDQLFKRWDRRTMDTSALRFRLQSLQSRYSSFVDLWDRALRAREEGRRSPLFRVRERTTIGTPSVAPSVSPGTSDEGPRGSGGTEGSRTVTFTDPRHESDKLRTLYDLLMDARRQAGEGEVPFAKFADLVKEQTRRLKKKGLDEVTFSVTMSEGRVNLTAKGSKPSS
jgi:hypothetical protein